MGNFLIKIFSAGASSLVEAVGDAIDKNVTSDEERKELENELAKASMQFEQENAMALQVILYTHAGCLDSRLASATMVMSAAVPRVPE